MVKLNFPHDPVTIIKQGFHMHMVNMNVFPLWLKKENQISVPYLTVKCDSLVKKTSKINNI